MWNGFAWLRIQDSILKLETIKKLARDYEETNKTYWEIIVKLGSCSSLLKFLNSTLKVSIQKEKEQSWRYNLSAPTTTHNF